MKKKVKLLSRIRRSTVEDLHYKLNNAHADIVKYSQINQSLEARIRALQIELADVRQTNSRIGTATVDVLKERIQQLEKEIHSWKKWKKIATTLWNSIAHTDPKP